MAEVASDDSAEPATSTTLRGIVKNDVFCERSGVCGPAYQS